MSSLSSIGSRGFLYKVLIWQTDHFTEMGWPRTTLSSIYAADKLTHTHNRLRELHGIDLAQIDSPQRFGCAMGVRTTVPTFATSRLYLSLISPRPFPSRFPMR